MNKPPATNPDHPLHVNCSVLADGTTVITHLLTGGGGFRTTLFPAYEGYTGRIVRYSQDRDQALLYHNIMRGSYERETGQEDE